MLARRQSVSAIIGGSTTHATRRLGAAADIEGNVIITDDRVSTSPEQAVASYIVFLSMEEVFQSAFDTAVPGLATTRDRHRTDPASVDSARRRSRTPLDRP
jgi:hypothetical protein